MKLDDDHQKRLNDLRTLSKVYAKAKGDEVYLSHFRKSQLAILTAEIMASDKCSHAAAETQARTRAEYIDVLVGLSKAVKESSQAYWELRISENAIGLLRSKMANERAEMGLT